MHGTPRTDSSLSTLDQPTADPRIIVGRRRFTCLSPGLVRVEFAPDGVFEDRRSMVAYQRQVPLPFTKVSLDGAWNVLDTGDVQIRTCDNRSAVNRLNLEIRWNDGKLAQFWRPEDRDYQNLGGTLRSLDRYHNAGCVLDGVHPATMESPDFTGTSWPAWFQCEVDPLYDSLHPAAPGHFQRGDWLTKSKEDHNDGTFLERTFNWYKESRKFCPGILSRSGYYFLNDSLSAVLDADDFPIERDRPGYQDYYLFVYKNDYRQALRDFRLLSGPAPVPRHKSFGVIFSRWPAFTEKEVVDLSVGFKANGYPLSTLVMDMEWHKEGWGHWEFNPELIPDPKRFFALCTSNDLDVTFNDHPLDVREDDIHYADYVAQAGDAVEIREREYNGKKLKMAKVDICNKQQNQAFRKVCHPEFMTLGLDYWWNDGSRGQLAATCGQLVTNKVFFEESQRENRRGMLLARYGGLGSHRYGAFFTGDANSDYHVLRLQCEFNIRAGGVGIGYVSHDIGGFMIGASGLQKNAADVAIINPALYTRWLQFGVFTPILRFHSAPGCGSRKPYDYDEFFPGVCRHWLRVRHSLLPYIYTAARYHHDTGLPMIRGLFLEHADAQESYRYDQFYFGQNMLVAPMLSDDPQRSVYLPSGKWWDFNSDQLIAGGAEVSLTVAIGDIPVFVKAGAVIPRQSPDAPLHAGHIKDLIVDAYVGADGESELYEDDGHSTGYQRDDICRTAFTMRNTGNVITVTGRISEGTPLAAQRSLTITLHSEREPQAAMADGKRALSWVRSGPHTYTIAVGAMPSHQSWTVAVTLV